MRLIYVVFTCSAVTLSSTESYAMSNTARSTAFASDLKHVLGASPSTPGSGSSIRDSLGCGRESSLETALTCAGVVGVPTTTGALHGAGLLAMDELARLDVAEASRHLEWCSHYVECATLYSVSIENTQGHIVI
jgi:hypothetical protein